MSCHATDEATATNRTHVERLARSDRLLVVDDEPEVVELMVEFAGRAGYDAISTSRPRPVSTALYDDYLDVIVLDLLGCPTSTGSRSSAGWPRAGAAHALILMSGFDGRVLEAAQQVRLSRTACASPGALEQAAPPGTDLTELLDADGTPCAPRRVAHAVEVDAGGGCSRRPRRRPPRGALPAAGACSRRDTSWGASGARPLAASRGAMPAARHVRAAGRGPRACRCRAHVARAREGRHARWPHSQRHWGACRCR